MYRKQMQKQGYIIIDSNVYDIPKRLRDYDPNLFVVYCPWKEEYQVWSHERGLQFVTRVIELDSRTIEKVKRADGRTQYGIKAKLEELKAQKEYTERKEREDAHDVAQTVKQELYGMDIGRKSFVM